MVAFNTASKEGGADLVRSAEGGKRGRLLSFTVRVGRKVLDAYLFGPFKDAAETGYSILVKDGDQSVAGVTLFEEPGLPFPAYSIGDAGVIPKWIGHGIMRVVYHVLVVDYDFALVGGSHSEGARKTWSRLAGQSDIVAYAADNRGFYKALLTPSEYRFEDDFGRSRVLGMGHLVLLVKKSGKIDKYISHVVEQRRRLSALLTKPDLTHQEVVKLLNEPRKTPSSPRKLKLGGITRR